MSNVDRMFYKLDREKIWEKQGKRCFYCKEPLNRHELTMDHVIPISQTGYQHTVGNCVVACLDCNQKKANHKEMPQEAEPELEPWEITLRNGLQKLDDQILRMRWRWHPKPMGSFNRWKKYMAKHGEL